jgi:hypothetical protein
MMPHASLVDLVWLLAAAAGGLAFGVLYFAALRRSIELFVHRAGWVGPAALTVGRIAAAAMLFGLLSRLGPGAVLAGFLAFLAARGLAVRAARKEG